MTGQIVFDLEKKDNFSVDDFIISETNNEVTSTLENMDQLLNKCAIVYGPKKSGKTHIAHIWQKRYEANYSDFSDVKFKFDFDASKNNVIDNFHMLEHDKEELFFHFYNDSVNQKKSILITIDNTSSKNIQLPDLKSRINSFHSVEIYQPDDHLVKVLLFKYFSIQQIKIDTGVVEFLNKRISRNYEDIYLTLQKINKLSLEHKSKITIPFLNKFLTF